MAIKDKDKMVVSKTTPMGVSAQPHDHEHEERDVNIRALLWSLASIAITVGAVCLIVWGMFRFFESREEKKDIVASPVADTNAVPPQPRLQASAALDMAVFRHMQDSLINHYGWVDRPAGVARIPIDSAIAIVARQGLEIVRNAPTNQPTGTDTSRITPSQQPLPSEVRPQGTPLERR